MGNKVITPQKQEYDDILPRLGQLNYADDEKPPGKGCFAKKQAPFHLNDAVKLSLRLKRKVVQSTSFHSQTFPMLASIKVENLPSFQKPPIDLVCVIDHSGSMAQAIYLVRQALNSLMGFLGDSDRLSIVVFDDTAYRLFPLMRMTNKGKQKALQAINNVNVSTEGGTDIELGLAHGLDILRQRRYFNPITSIFLLSDGMDARVSEKVRKTMAQFNTPQDITINTFGLGFEHDAQLLSNIASLRDGNFYLLKDYNQINEAFVDCLGGLQSSVCRNAQLSIKPEQSSFLKGVDIIRAYGEETTWATIKDEFITKMTNLVCGKTKNFVLELRLPASKELSESQKGVKVATAGIHMIGLDGKEIIKQADLHVTLVNEIKDDEEDDDREVMKNYYRVKGASLINEAKGLADKKKFEEAKKILQNFKEELENSLLNRQEFVKKLIVDINKAIQDVNPTTYETAGKLNMIANARAHMLERSNLGTEHLYQNDIQQEMLDRVDDFQINLKNDVQL